VFERATGRITRRFSASNYQTAAVSSDGTLVAAAKKTSWGVWNLTTGKSVLSPDYKRAYIYRLSFSPDNKLISVLSDDGAGKRLDIVEVATGHHERHPTTGTFPAWNAGYWTGHDLIVTLSTPGVLNCSDVRNWTTRWETKPREQRVWAAAISPDRSLLLTADDHVLTLQDCAGGNVRYRAPCEYEITWFTFTADGRSFVVGGKQGQLSVWTTATGQQLFEIANIGTPIESVQPLETGILASTRRVKDGRSEIVWLEF
jgi:WD40 repeat protein